MSLAHCPEGTRLTAGGYFAQPQTNSAGENVDALDINAPSPQYPNTWGTQLVFGRITTYALCSR